MKHKHFSAEEIHALREALKRAHEDMEQYRKDSEVKPEMLKQKISVFVNCKRVR